jgi:transcriptional regulator with XRE-family HTH domain
MRISGDKVRKLVQESGLNQCGFALSAGIDNATLVRIVSGEISNPTIETVIKIANFSKILDVRELMEEKK